jgi:putative PIN family toxin of toxin-antitoxin system
MTSPTTPAPTLKIVPDTGFYIAAALKDGYARNYLVGRGSAFLKYELYSSEAILAEFQDKIENTFGFERYQVVKVITEMRRILTIVYPTQKLGVVRDPDDNKIIECAVEAKVDLILAFDKDLLVLKEYEGIKIIHPTMLKYMFA